jgi:hypothetical protein
MIKVGDLVKWREDVIPTGDWDAGFEGEVGLVLDSDSFEGLTPNDEVWELLVEWCGRSVALWENPEHVEKLNE